MQTLRGIPRGLAKRTLSTHGTRSTHAHNSHYWQRTTQQIVTTTVRQQTPATASPYLKRVGGPLPARAAGTPTSGSKTTLQSSKTGNTYCRIVQSSGNRVNASTTTLVRTKTTPAKLVDKPSARTRRDNGAHGTPERPRETGVSRHNTNIPDLHEVGKEQPGVTLRDTKQPIENDVSPQAQPPLTSTRSRAHKQNHPAPRTLHEVRELHLPVPPRRHQGTGYRNSSWVPTRGTPREPAERKPLNTTHVTKLTKSMELDTARLQPSCKVGQREIILGNSVRNTIMQEHISQRQRQLRGGHTVHFSSSPAADSCLQPPQ
ncbi:hypothetical protein Taro_000931 [Colocasia esculenta]|uniref:Uncharacterized protein n=1 Tax=Colocasia esculenta TaxID=4460 RepID=A0A843TDD0_COLES|nr:hypothetical protein [Colocasia esculenta]